MRAEYSHKVYKPDCYPLFDIFLSEYQGNLLHVSFDAIIIDMTSFEILFGEWIALYHDENLVLPPLDISYRDYQLQYERLRGGALFERAQQWRCRKSMTIRWRPDYRWPRIPPGSISRVSGVCLRRYLCRVGKDRRQMPALQY